LVLLCAERDVGECHRHLLGEYLAERGHVIEHLVGPVGERPVRDAASRATRHAGIRAVDLIDAAPGTDASRIDGLSYREEFLTRDEEEGLFESVDAQPWLTGMDRRVQLYGYHCPHARGAVGVSGRLATLPQWSEWLAARLVQDRIVESMPEQLSVNEYMAGQGISAHVDCPICYGPTIVAISLGSAYTMRFTSTTGPLEAYDLRLTPRSVLAMRGAARDSWRHEIKKRKTDRVDGRPLARGRRVSLTFRTLRVTDA
jgi:alkylated DNA repair dioxygenase AlkB